MWCRICRQDVPVVAGAPGRAVACPRCGGRLDSDCLGGSTAELEAVAEGGIDLTGQQFAEVTGIAPPVPWDNWELNQQMQSVRRIASRANRDQHRTSWDPEHVVRIDRSHSGRRAENGPTSMPDDTVEPPAEYAARGPLTWLSLGLGLACATCGALLAATGLFQSRSDLWNIGLPLVVAGQLALLLGLMLRLCQAKRAARARAVATCPTRSAQVS